MGHPMINALPIETAAAEDGPLTRNDWDAASVHLPNGGQAVFMAKFQQGLVDEEDGPNGIGIEQLLLTAIMRLEMWQEGDGRCRENAIAITKLQEALHWLDHRTGVREAQGVANTYAPHA